MRFAENFHPEWGYLAPAPSFMRTARIVVVATAIGATAGAAVVLSLAERPGSNAVADTGKRLVVVHSLVQPAEAAAPASIATATAAAPIVAAPVTGPAQAPVNARASAQSGDKIAPTPASPSSVMATAPAPSDSRAASTTEPPASVAALAEAPAATADAAAAGPAPDAAAAQKNAAAKQRLADDDALHSKPTGPVKRKSASQGLGSLFRHLFNTHSGSSYFPN
jgi:hypothetical protein